MAVPNDIRAQLANAPQVMTSVLRRMKYCGVDVNSVHRWHDPEKWREVTRLYLSIFGRETQVEFHTESTSVFDLTNMLMASLDENLYYQAMKVMES